MLGKDKGATAVIPAGERGQQKIWGHAFHTCCSFGELHAIFGRYPTITLRQAPSLTSLC